MATPASTPTASATQLASTIPAGEVVSLLNEFFRVVVDTVNAVLDIPDTEIEPPPTFGTHIRTEFIRGMGKVGTSFVVIIEPDRVFDVDEMAELCESSVAAQAA